MRDVKDMVCPDCERIIRYDDHSQAYICKYCHYRKDFVPPVEILELQKEIVALRVQLKECQEALKRDIHIKDRRYCVYGGDKRLKAGVFYAELQQINARTKVITYSFHNLESDQPRTIIYRSNLWERTFDNREDAEKFYRKMMNRRGKRDGRFRAVLTAKERAEKNRQRAKEEEETSEVLYE